MDRVYFSYIFHIFEIDFMQQIMDNLNCGQLILRGV